MLPLSYGESNEDWDKSVHPLYDGKSCSVFKTKKYSDLYDSFTMQKIVHIWVSYTI